jgi:hypothetical protein
MQLPETNAMYAVWGFSASDVYAVGSGYDIYHYDGMEWTSVKHWTDDWRTFYAIWGTSPTNLYAVGGFDVYNVSPHQGRILRYDGSDWTEIDTGLDLTGIDLEAIWGSSSSDIYVVGDYQSSNSRIMVLHYDGSDWSFVEDPVWGDNSIYFCSVWGRNGNDVYIGSTWDNVYHFDGTSWEDITDHAMINGNVNGLWTSTGNVYGCTSYGEIPKYDGSTWTESQGGPFGTCRSMWVGSDTDAIAVGESGFFKRYDGTAWGAVVTGSDHDNFSYYGISGVENNWFVSASSGRLLWNHGSGWDLAGGGFNATYENLYDVWASGNEAFAVGDDGAIVYFDGTDQILMTNGSADKRDLYAVWGSSTSDVYAVGYDGTLLHFDGSGTIFQPIEDVAENFNLWAVWGTSSNNVYVSGEAGFLARYNGSTWERIWVDETDYIRGINGNGPEDFYMCASSRVYHYDGTRIRKVTQSVTYETLYDINISSAGDLFACGYRGTIIHVIEE